MKLLLRDGIDLYYDDTENLAIFIYLASRAKLKIIVDKTLLLIISSLDGSKTLKEYALINKLTDLETINLIKFGDYLYDKNILIEHNWIDLLDFSNDYKSLLDRQFKYLLDITSGGVKEVERVQKKIYTSKIAIFGLGAVGSNLARELAMMGFVNFVLIDHDNLDLQDISRNILFNHSNVGKSKVSIAKKMLLDINKNIEVTILKSSLNIDTNLEFIDDCNLIINSANAPYIGYTSIKLSRYCIKMNKLLFVCGGFDAHLASLGELIIPKVTPCSDCYTTYFSEALKDWKPMKHPITDRENVFGGLVSLSLFSASVAAMTIFKYFIDSDSENLNRRGEFLFDDYSLYEFTVPKDKNCQYCSS